MKWCAVINIFPALVDAFSACGMVQKAIHSKQLELKSVNLRDFSENHLGYIDDRPFGGGHGMVLKPEPLISAIESVKSQAPSPARVIYLSPAGKTLTQAKAISLAESEESLIFIAGRYEGIDQRVIDTQVDECISIGDYVLSGGELAAMVVIDAMVRWLPDVLGHPNSVHYDAFSPSNNGLLDCPQYTRPNDIEEIGKVPEVLLSGDHQAIKRWRKQQSLGQTWLHRPDLLEKANLCVEDIELLTSFQKSWAKQNEIEI